MARLLIIAVALLRWTVKVLLTAADTYIMETPTHPQLVRSARSHALEKTGLRIGRHYSPGGKHALAGLAQALDEGASAIQMFAGNPRHYWASRHIVEDPASVESFRKHSAHLYKVVHAPYITNIAPDPDGEDSRSSRMTQHCLVNQLEWAENMGFDSVVFHPGSPKGGDRKTHLEWSANLLKEVMIEYAGPVSLLMENAAHRGKIGGEIEDLTYLIDAVNDTRLGICIDVTHAYASGLNIVEIGDLPQLLGESLRLIHFNQPDNEKGSVKMSCGCQLDVHSSSFNEGHLSHEDLFYLYYRMRHLPLILEGTPDLPADLIWLMIWETSLRNGEEPPKPAPPSLGDLFDLE